MWGVRYSLGVSVLVIVSAAVLSTIIGGLAGLFREPIDSVLRRTTDVILAFTYLMLAIAIASAVGPGLTTVIVALTAAWWPGDGTWFEASCLRLRSCGFGFQLHFDEESAAYEVRDIKHCICGGNGAHRLRVSSTRFFPVGAGCEIDPRSNHIVHRAAERLHCTDCSFERDQRLSVRVA